MLDLIIQLLLLLRWLEMTKLHVPKKYNIHEAEDDVKIVNFGLVNHSINRKKKTTVNAY